VYEAATTFTDLRRPQILRRLAHHGAATTLELVAALSMSQHAVGRHAAKLRRRGYVVTQKPGPGVRPVHELAGAFKTSNDAKLSDRER